MDNIISSLLLEFKIVNSKYFIFISCFSFSFLLCLFLRLRIMVNMMSLSHCHVSHRRVQKILEKIMLYSVVATTYQKTNDHTSGKSLSGISSGELIRELDKESLLNQYPIYILSTSGPCYNLMSASFLTQGDHVAYICSDVIFQIFPLCSRLMMSHHVTCHVTAMSRASSLSLTRKEKKRKDKQNSYKVRK